MKLVGLDVAGWHDFAAKDWDLEAANDQFIASKVIDGGIGAVAIRDSADQWIGGPQAILAPHGLGNGWGILGGKDRRIAIANCFSALISGSTTVNGAYCAAVESLTRHADGAILNVADRAELDEGARSHIYRAAKGRLKQLTLLWRPVALCIEAYRNGLIKTTDVGQWFGFLIHSGEGFEFQKLCIRKDSEHEGHYAPEREAYGVCIKTKLGLEYLSSFFTNQIIKANPNLEDWPIGRIELAPGLLMGRIDPGSRHVIRHDNRSWIEVIAPENLSLPFQNELPDLLEATIRNYGHLERLFFTSPLGGSLADQLKILLERLVPKCSIMPWSSLALGALYAGRTIEKGLPHYFDRLTPISLAVFEDEKPSFADLVDRDATLPANKPYEPPPYKKLAWQKGTNKIEFNVLKGDAEVRRWEIEIDNAPTSTMPVELIFRQTPGQSWAKLYLTSSEWDFLRQNPISLDWDTLKPTEETREAVLKRLQHPPPTIPIRITEPPSILFWRGSEKYAPISDVIKQEPFRCDLLSKLLNRSMREQTTDGSIIRRWPVGTDGNLPDELTDNEIRRFDQITKNIETTLLEAINLKKSRPNNDELKTLTWLFVRCPKRIQTAIIDALEADLRGSTHPLLRPLQSRTVLIQGAGRSVSGSDGIRRILDVLIAVEPFYNLRKANNNTFSALGMLLARRYESPVALDDQRVQMIATIVSAELSRLVQSNTAKGFQVRFKNALLALAGLFRYREIKPFALLKGSDKTASQLWDDLGVIQQRLEENASIIPQAEAKIVLVGEILKHLEGHGNPEVLIVIDAPVNTPEDDESILGL
jgi:hypothetical protein